MLKAFTILYSAGAESTEFQLAHSNLKVYFCGGNAAFFFFPQTCAAGKHLISEKPLIKRFFKGTGVSTHGDRVQSGNL